MMTPHITHRALSGEVDHEVSRRSRVYSAGKGEAGVGTTEKLVDNGDLVNRGAHLDA
jgi:hypothetical protein